MSQITATVGIPTQVCAETWEHHFFSRVFSDDLPVRYIIDWAKNMGLENATINNISFSDYTGGSL